MESRQLFIKVLLYLVDLSYSVVSEEDHRWIRSEDGSGTLRTYIKR